MRAAWRANAVLAAAVLLPFQGLFLRIDDLKGFDAPFFEFPAHDLRQGIDAGLIDVGYFKARRVQLVAGAHAADNRNLPFLRFFSQAQFAAHRIDGVYNIIIMTGKETVCHIGHIKILYTINCCLRIDIQNPLLHHFCFLLAYGLARGMDLTVNIRQAYEVIIDKN